MLSGPLSSESPNTLGGVFSATWNRATYAERDGKASENASLGSAFINVTGRTGRDNDIRVIAWGQRTRDAVPNHAVFDQPDAGQVQSALHTQLSWQRSYAEGDGGLRAFGAYTIGRRTSDLIAPSAVVVERLRDGPVTSLLDPGIGTDRAWSAGVRVGRSASNGRHRFLAGLDVSGGSATVQSVFTGSALEFLNGIPARIWVFTDPPEESRWSERSVALFAGDTWTLSPRLTVNAGIRFETINGSAEAHSATIAWRNLLPRGGFNAALLDRYHVSVFGQAGRYGHRLPLSDLAYGDPTAPTAEIYRAVRVGASIGAGPLVQRLGPGSRGVAGFSTIDPELQRPVMDEAVLGFEGRPHPALFVRIAVIGRRETSLVGVVDTGVPESAYSTLTVPDTGIDVVSAGDDQLLTFYNRPVSSFGADRYVLTNPAGHDASFVGADILIHARAGRTYFLLGGTAGRQEGIAANRGYGPLENDPGLLGEAFINPNALDHARGRDFTERGYTIKLAATHQFGGDWTFGATARYQDGQHFARMVILQGLNQGPEAVRAFRNGRTRFSMTSTLDVRLQKGFMLGGRRLAAILEGYNVLNEYFEYEEVTVSGSTSRNPTATQPPRAIHLGVRIPF